MNKNKPKNLQRKRIIAFAALMAITTVFAYRLQYAKAAADTDLYFSDPGTPGTSLTAKTVSVGDDFTIVAALNPNTNQVSGTELHVTFDPTVFSLTSITAPSAPSDCAATPAFSTVLVGANRDNVNGKGSIVLGVCLATPSAPVVTSTAVATFVFHALASANTSNIGFSTTNPDVTQITAIGESQSVLSKATPVTMTVLGGPHTVGGTISNLSGMVVLRNNGGDNLNVTANGSFVFTTPVAQGGAYNVTVYQNPVGQTCTVDSGGSGTMGTNDVTDVSVSCANIPTHTIGGTLSGLTSGSVVLQNNAGDNLTVNSSGSFTFATGVAEGSGYNVTVLSKPSDLNCSVTNGIGTMSTSDVANIGVACVDNPAVLAAGSPSSVLPAGTTQTTISVTTNENASCKYSTTPGVAYASMTNTFIDNGTAHTALITGLADSSAYNYYVRCQDSQNTVNTSDYLIAFSIGTPAPVLASSDDHHDSKKSDTPARSLTNSKKNVHFGDVLVQRGKKFSKKSPVLLYFGKPGGGYYAPTKVITSSNGAFSVSYKVTKPKGRYGWYAVDVKSGKKSKLVYYTVK